VTQPRILRSESYPELPWKNGGGTTHEIAAFGNGEPQWRVSLATIDRDGPFSDFSGYDRTIVPVDGAGFELELDGNERIVLARRYEPFRFTGEQKVECRLLAGRSRDLNAMTLRSHFRHDVRAVALASERRVVEVSHTSFLFVAGDVTVACRGDTFALREGDTLACDEAVRLELSARAPGTVVLFLQFTRV
jgi:environmental stress-induced protein Ves